MNNEFMNILMDNAYKSLESNDVPIGALIVKNNEIIATGYNTREKNQNILGHAEINAIITAQAHVNNWNFSGFDLYVTLTPCSMCMEIIKQCRFDNVFYLLDKPLSKKEFNKTKVIKINDIKFENEYKKILSDFFKKMREK